MYTLCPIRSILLVFQEPRLYPLIHGKLVAYHSPVRHRTPIPLFIQFRNPQIQGFPDSVFAGEGAFLCHLAETGIDSFYAVGRIHHFAYRAFIVKNLFHVLPVAYPYIHSSRVLAPCLFETFKLLFRRFPAGSFVYFL